ncbi:MAG: prepilin-type N-terminal cleavage/methylation domain-containing protein [Phycisphaerales bacterium]|nr:MAG: prepilin-type N-terminal cleavage/methylation domain-containing protein [Phycisphaerales bacterium]
MDRRRGYTVAELLVVVLIIGVLAAVGVPRLQFGLRDRSQGSVTAWKIVTDLRRTRSLAILHAATNPQGFALNVRRQGKNTTYDLVDLSNSRVVESHAIDSSVVCEGGASFQFGPLGALKDGSDSSLELSLGPSTFELTVVPATGTVRCVEN